MSLSYSLEPANVMLAGKEGELVSAYLSQICKSIRCLSALDPGEGLKPTAMSHAGPYQESKGSTMGNRRSVPERPKGQC